MPHRNLVLIAEDNPVSDFLFQDVSVYRFSDPSKLIHSCFVKQLLPFAHHSCQFQTGLHDAWYHTDAPRDGLQAAFEIRKCEFRRKRHTPITELAGS